jgi:hypothetical protein
MATSKRKVLIQAGELKHEIELDSDQKEVTIIKLGTDQQPAVAEEYQVFHEKFQHAVKHGGVLLWNHRLEVVRVKP